MLRWWRRRRKKKRVGHPDVRFEVVGEATVARAWKAAGEAGPLRWSARMRREADEVAWRVEVEGVLTGTAIREGAAANAYAAGDECRAALRRIVDEYNALRDAAG